MPYLALTVCARRLLRFAIRNAINQLSILNLLGEVKQTNHLNLAGRNETLLPRLHVTSDVAVCSINIPASRAGRGKVHGSEEKMLDLFWIFATRASEAVTPVAMALEAIFCMCGN